MKPLPFHIVTGFADLVDRAHDAAFDDHFPANGSFVKMKRGAQSYWYHMAYDPKAPNKQKSRYAGPAGDPQVDALVASHGKVHADHKARKAVASSMRQSGLPSPDGLEGELALAFQKAGLFQAGAVLVGSVAYQCYGGLLGVRMDGAYHRTQDKDLAQDREIALHVAYGNQRLDDFGAILKRVDPTFEPDFNPMRPQDGPTRYSNSAQYRVDLLTTHLRTDRDRSAPVIVPGLPGSASQPLDLMHYLIGQPVRSILLHDAGVAVKVPEPSRYAMHKIVISQMRSLSSEGSKSTKDLMQASELIRSLQHARRSADMAAAWNAMFGEKPKWRKKLAAGALGIDEDALGHIAAAVIRHGGEPFRDHENPAQILRSLLMNEKPVGQKNKKDG